MRPQRVLLACVPLLMAAQGAAGALEDAPPAAAGPAELQAMSQEIGRLQQALESQDVQLQRLHRSEVAFLGAQATTLLGQARDPQGATPRTLSDFPAWYLDALQRRLGFSPLSPMPGWVQRWDDLRARERPHWQAYEELAVACHRLERLRSRLRRQLRLPGADGDAEGAAVPP
jgi:hypothetical protein